MACRKAWTLAVPITSGDCLRVLSRCNPLGGLCDTENGSRWGLGRQGSLAPPLPGSVAGASLPQAPVSVAVKRDNLARAAGPAGLSSVSQAVRGVSPALPQPQRSGWAWAAASVHLTQDMGVQAVARVCTLTPPHCPRGSCCNSVPQFPPGNLGSQHLWCGAFRDVLSVDTCGALGAVPAGALRAE